jgi:DNA-binding transcriptional ArsR family regulator
VIRYRLGAGAASVRWAMSPIHEVVSLAQLLTEPRRHPMYQQWLRRRQHRLAGLDLSALTVFMADGAYRPDCPDGLLLIPSLFITDRVQCTTSDHWTPAIYYPAPGRYLWAAPPTPRSLDRLLGTTRSKILAALVTPLQTTVVAGLVGVTAPTASEHLATLRSAGLIDSSRSGRTVTHELTTAGRALLDAASPR